MHSIKKHTLFTELTVEQSAHISGGNGNELLEDLVKRLKESGATVNVTNSSNPVSNNPGSTASAPDPLRGLVYVSGGTLKSTYF